jgi:hypothetical protein
MAAPFCFVRQEGVGMRSHVDATLFFGLEGGAICQQRD